tara:strand:+ start:491 stop:787 length:297 start_codon:yes stop_codon:yes gene_type:complete
MTCIHFNNPEELADLFRSKSRKITDAIVAGIEEAMRNNSFNADLFEITFEDSDRMFEISLPRREWVPALEASLDHYHDLELSDEQIDTWKLLEAAKLF